MTASDRFGLIILAITVVAGVFGWLVRSLWSTQNEATKANTSALTRLTEAIGRLDSRISTLEGRMDGPGRRGK